MKNVKNVFIKLFKGGKVSSGKELSL